MDDQDLPDLAPWRVVEKLGEGGQCAVYRVARDDQPGERAVKVMFDRTPGALDRFVAEARLLQSLDHPNIMKVYDIAADARPPWIVMELLAGRDLDEEMQLGALEPERAAALIADVAAGLAMVHSLGIRHRDIKPSNIMVGSDGVPRLIDFGIAREISQAHLTQAGMVIGTMAYLPPELFDSDDPREVQDTPSADVYALGQTLYEILTGEPAWPRDGGTTKLLALIMREKLEKPYLDPHAKRVQVPDDLAEIVRAATAQNPAQRIATAAELEERLRGWIEKRNEAHTARVSRVDPTQLPPPPARPGSLSSSPPSSRPGSLPSARPGSLPSAANVAAPPRPPAMPSSPRTDTVEAPARGGGGVVLMSTVGAGALVAVVGLVALVAIAGLWALRPVALDATSAAGVVAPAVRQQAPSLAACAAGLDPAARKDKTVVVRFDVWQERPYNVAVEQDGLGDPRVGACLVQGVQAMTFAGVPDMPVRVPFQLQ